MEAVSTLLDLHNQGRKRTYKEMMADMMAAGLPTPQPSDSESEDFEVPEKILRTATTSESFVHQVRTASNLSMCCFKLVGP